MLQSFHCRRRCWPLPCPPVLHLLRAFGQGMPSPLFSRMYPPAALTLGTSPAAECWIATADQGPPLCVSPSMPLCSHPFPGWFVPWYLDAQRTPRTDPSHSGLTALHPAAALTPKAATATECRSVWSCSWNPRWQRVLGRMPAKHRPF